MPEQTTIGDIIAYFDKLYETPANRAIGWEWAYILATMDARDDDDNDRLSLIKYLRANKTLPFQGALEGPGDKPGTVLVRSEGVSHSIRLAGIIVPNETDAMVREILTSLSATADPGSGASSCNSTNKSNVDLVYGYDLFNKVGELSAQVKLSKFISVCAGRKLIAISDLSNDNPYLQISYFLTRNGLALVDEDIDSKWSEQRQAIRELTNMINNADLARLEGLYLFGSRKSKYVEMLRHQGNL